MIDEMSEFFGRRDEILEALAAQEMNPRNIGRETANAIKDSAEEIGRIIAEQIAKVFGATTQDSQMAARIQANQQEIGLIENTINRGGLTESRELYLRNNISDLKNQIKEMQNRMAIMDRKANDHKAITAISAQIRDVSRLVESQNINQEMTVTANFPNVTDRKEIQEAFSTLPSYFQQRSREI